MLFVLFLEQPYKCVLLHTQISELENEKQDLMKELNEQKAQHESHEKREREKRQIEEKKHNEEIQCLKRANQQLKVTLCNYIPKKNIFIQI